MLLITVTISANNLTTITATAITTDTIRIHKVPT